MNDHIRGRELSTKNIVLTIAYDGTHYLGWQKTAMGPSIEGALEKALVQILQQPVALQAASRTDAGVHAKGQVVNFTINEDTSIDLGRLHISLNQLLPKSIAVSEIAEYPAAFHPTLDCIGKEYHYQICLGKSQYPLHRFYSWHCPSTTTTPIDIGAMNEGAALLIGRHSFQAFCNFKKNSNYRDYIRTIERISIVELPEERLCIEIEGDHFLYKMVRNMVGTLIYIGKGKLRLSQIPELLQSGSRIDAGVTAPAHGLTLFRVNYKKQKKTYG
jgi:tRNA pseudouridine38-40 synthase